MKNQLGFTLVELMLSVMIIVLLSGLGVISLNNFNSRQKVDSAEAELTSILKLSRNYATSLQKPKNMTGGLDSVRVTFSGNSVTVDGVEAGTMTRYNFFSKGLTAKEVGIGTTPANAVVDFMSYKGNIRGTSAVDIIIGSTGGVTFTSKLQITNSGMINEN